jgi:hypothetical protein
MLTATSYRSMYAFGNHYRVASVEEGFTTCDSGIACTTTNQANIIGFYNYMGYKRTLMTRTTFSQKQQVALDNMTRVTSDRFCFQQHVSMAILGPQLRPPFDILVPLINFSPYMTKNSTY